jgi:hypothetical protein
MLKYLEKKDKIMARPRKIKNVNVWDREKIDPVLREYKALFKTKIDKSQKPQKVEHILTNPEDKLKADKLFSEIYDAFTSLYWASGNMTRNGKVLLKEMEADVLSNVYQEYMLRWDPDSKTSSMSYFLYIIQQRIAWFFTNKLACSNKLTRIDKRFVDCLIKIDENNLKKNKRKTVKEAKEEAEKILKERFDGSEDYKVIRYNATYFAIVHREKLIVRDFSEYEDFQDIEPALNYNHFQNVDFEEVGYYIPDVVVSKKHQELAHTLLDFVKDVVDGEINLRKNQSSAIWIINALQTRTSYAVNPFDVKIAKQVLRKAYQYYLEENNDNLAPPTIYGSLGAIKSSDNEYY